MRRLLGIDAKLRQYRDGERFVRGAVERAGMDGFNQGLGPAGEPADQGRDRRPGRLGRPGRHPSRAPRLTLRSPPTQLFCTQVRQTRSPSWPRCSPGRLS